MIRAVHVFAVVTMIAAAPLQAQPAASVQQAVTSGTPELSLRPRMEWAEDDAQPRTAYGLTVRTLAGWRTAAYRDFDAHVLVGSSVQLVDDFNDGRNGRTQYPFSNTPEKTDFTEAYLRWRGIEGVSVVAGRQKVDLDRTRFVGPNEFRQTQRWYQGVSATIDVLPDAGIYLGHFLRERGPDTGQRELRVEMARADYEWARDNMLLASAYLHDQVNAIGGTGFTDNSYKILSLRADGAIAVDPRFKLTYTVERGMQRPYQDGDDRIRAGYTRLSGGLRWERFFFSVDYEALGSNGGVYAMQTPLGLLHPSQGWADKFNRTPAEGVQDRWLSVGYAFGQYSFYGEAHRFRSDFGGIDYGDEIDLRFDWNLRKNLQLRNEFSRFEASGDPRNSLTDATRIWVTLSWTVY
jgi:hypothetical protein